MRDRASTTRAKKAAKAARRVHHAPSREDRFVTEAMAPRAVFVPSALIKKPGRQFDPTPNPAKRYQPVGPAPKAKKGAKKTYTPYERALGRVVNIDIKHQQRNQLIAPSRATPKAAAAAASRSHAGAAKVLSPRPDWKPRESNFGDTLSAVGGAVAGVGRYAWEHQRQIQHPDEAIRNRVISDASQAVRGNVEPAAHDIQTFSGINPRHPLNQGPYWLGANIGMAVIPGGLGRVGRVGEHLAESAAGRVAKRAIEPLTAKRLRELSADPEHLLPTDLTKGHVDPKLHKAVREAIKETDLSVFREHGIDAKVLARSVAKGEAGRHWYRDSGKQILKLAGGNKPLADKFAQLVSIYSAQREPIPNMQLAVNAMREWKAKGVIESFGTGPQIEKANAIMRGEGFEGVKTDRFYKNHLKHIDSAKYKRLFGQGESTHDIWMARLFGLKTDNPTPREYAAMEGMLRKLSAKTGWAPEELQAAMWISKKAHDEGTSIAEAGLSFADALRHESGIVPFEAAPGRAAEPALYDLYAKLPAIQQRAYTRDKARLVSQFLRESGIMGRLGIEGPGVYEGQVNPGWQAYVAASRGKGAENALQVTEEGKAALDHVAAAIGKAFNQDAAAWFKPFYRTNIAAKDANGLLLQLGRKVDADQARGLDQMFREAGHDIAIVPAPEGAYLLNFSELSNPEFHRFVDQSLDRVMPGRGEIDRFGFDGNFIGRDAYDAHLGSGAAGPPDVLSGAFARLQRGSEDLDVKYLAGRRGRGVAGAARRAGVSPGLGSAPLFGFERESEHGLLPDLINKLKRGEPLHDVPGRTPTGKIHGPKTYEEDIAARIQGQKSVRGKQEAGYKPQKAEKFRAYEQAYADAIASGAEPSVASAIARGKLKGKLAKLTSHAMEGLGEADMQKMISKAHEVLGGSVGERTRAAAAIENAFKGVVPTSAEIKLLERVFPPAQVETVVQAARAQKTLWDGFLDVFQIPRTMQSTGDFSALFRQALPVVTRHPKLWAESITPSIKAMKTKGDFETHYNGLWEKESTADFVDAGGAIQDVGNSFQGGARVEEAFGSASAEKLPIVGHAARQYTAFLNETRVNMWEQLLPKTEKLALRQAKRKGLDSEAALEKAHQDLARYINTMTGRGPLPKKLNQAAGLLNSLLFSPRLLASRADLLFSPITYARATPYVRRQAMRSMVQMAGVGTGVLALAAQIPGVDVGMNPLSSDFGRIKIGDTRIDIFGGFQPIVRLIAQLKAGEMISSVTGEKEPLNTGTFGGHTQLSIVMKFLRSKLSPNASFITDYLDGKDVVGNKFKWSDQWKRIVPMLATDIVDTARYKGPHAPAGLVGGLGALGFSTMTYGQNQGKNEGDLPDLPDLAPLPDLPELPDLAAP